MTIIYLAFECYESRYYVTGNDSHPLQCPGCAKAFSKVSSLFQHIESEACNESYDEGIGSLGDLRDYISSYIR